MTLLNNYIPYIKAWEAQGRNVSEALKIRFGLNKREIEAVLEYYNNNR